MKLTDHDTMKFGKHRGRELQNVPPDYLLWLADEMDPGESDYKDALLDYVAENRTCLEKEAAGEL